MRTLALPRRPKLVNQVTYPLRVDYDLKEKAMIAADRKGTDLAAILRGAMLDLVDEHEAKHGPIALPPSP
ncbi:hypothetical protein [Hymenobacter koreensis]